MTTVYSIGHSSLPIQALLDRLAEHRIDVVVDVRSKPYSPRFPEFDLPVLRQSLEATGVRYVHLPQLGGRPERSEFYDAEGRVLYGRLAESDDFRSGLDRLVSSAGMHRVAVLCSEEDPLRCHRWRLIGTTLEGVGIEMTHIRRDGRLETHRDVTLRDEAEHPEAYQLPLLAADEDHWRSTRPVRSR
jgi:uncharacterized protein (DUF488 family)